MKGRYQTSPTKRRNEQEPQPTKSMRTHLNNRIHWLAVCLLSAAASMSANALTPAEATSVLYMKQEEKLARDVYQAMAVRWDHVTFRNIATSEQRHLEAVDRLIARYGLTDPTPAEPGRFSIPELQKLHDDLIAQGSLSLVDALRVGVLVEETDIADLKEVMGVVSEPMLERVFGNLLRASGHHLNAFNAALGTVDANGVVISDSTMCPRGGTCAAPNGGRGQGNCLGNGGNGGNGRRNGARNGSAWMRPKDGVCPAGQGPEGCAAAESSGEPRSGAPSRRGRR